MKKLLILLIVASSVSLFANYNHSGYGSQGYGLNQNGNNNQRQTQGSQYYPPTTNLRGRYAADQAPQNPSPNTQNDQSFTGQIQHAARAFFSGKYQDVSINLSKGYITLTGTVPSQEDKETLEKFFLGIYGVQGVNNQLTVNPQK